jgi:hypothetical protein
MAKINMEKKNWKVSSLWIQQCMTKSPNVEDQHGNEELESVAAVDSTVHDDMYGGLNDSDLRRLISMVSVLQSECAC